MKRLELLDYARLLAASVVMAFHYLFNGIQNGKISSLSLIPGAADWAKYGYLGVEFFFIISGYVIFHSARNRSAAQFAVSRALRIYPAFWVAVLFTALVAAFWGGPQTKVTWLQTGVNLSMAPTLLGQSFVDGVYWTLQLELGFYALVLAVLLLGWQHRLERLFLAWPLLMAAALAVGLNKLPLLGGYYAYFAAGALFAMAKQRGSLRSPAGAALLLCLALCIHYSAGKAPELSIARHTAYDASVIAAIIASQFAFFALLHTRWASELRLPGAAFAGSLTYPLYLIHAHFGYMALSRWATDATRAWAYPLTMATALAIAWLIHTQVEQRGAALWKRLFERSVGAAVARLQAGVEGLRAGSLAWAPRRVGVVRA
jgi:peptidoglycan/LPS O-acetylase OafA/YrhL